jgi:hypothetical protein
MKNPRHLLRGFVLVTALLVANTGLAQGTRAESTSSEGWAPVQHLEFTPEEIEGGVFTPDGTRIESIVRAEHPSLIEIRAGFEAEIVKMVEDL